MSNDAEESSEGEHFAVFHPGPRPNQPQQRQPQNPSSINQAAFFENSDDEGHFEPREQYNGLYSGSNLAQLVEEQNRNQPAESQPNSRFDINNIAERNQVPAGQFMEVRQQYNTRLLESINRLVQAQRPDLQLSAEDVHRIQYRLGHEGEDEDDDYGSEDYDDLIELDEDIPIPVSASMQEQLPHAKFTQANKDNFSEENQTCTVCQSQYEIRDEYVILPCLHRFHTDCVSPWFERKNTCPVCKQPVSLGEQEQPAVQSRNVVSMLLREAVNRNEAPSYSAVNPNGQAAQRGSSLQVPVRPFFAVGGEEAIDEESEEDNLSGEFPYQDNTVVAQQERGHIRPNFQPSAQLQVQTRLQDMSLNLSPWQSQQQTNNLQRYQGSNNPMMFISQPDSPQVNSRVQVPQQMNNPNNSNQRPANNGMSGVIFERSAFAFDEEDSDDDQSFGHKH